jgi:hypothetical protein
MPGRKVCFTTSLLLTMDGHRLDGLIARHGKLFN